MMVTVSGRIQQTTWMQKVTRRRGGDFKVTIGGSHSNAISRSAIGISSIDWKSCAQCQVSQVSSMFVLDPLDYKPEKFVPNLEDLKRLLQQQKLSKSIFTFTSNTILSVLTSQQTSVGIEKFARLRYHHLTHSSVEPLKCPYCNKAYRQHKDLNCHVPIHTNPGVTPIACHLCDKRFYSHSSHKVHLLCHSGKRPHPCPHCD